MHARESRSGLLRHGRKAKYSSEFGPVRASDRSKRRQGYAAATVFAVTATTFPASVTRGVMGVRFPPCNIRPSSGRPRTLAGQPPVALSGGQRNCDDD